MTSKIKILYAFFILLFTIHSNAQKADVKSKKLINALIELNGGYQRLASHKDVEFTYIYEVLGKGKDVSTERYIFDGEQSWAQYNIHERHVFPNDKGIAIQSLVDGVSKMTFKNEPVLDKKEIQWSLFLRKVNFYWFSMMHKLKDPGTNFKYLGVENVNGMTYDKVSLTFDADVTKKKFNDQFILYFNPETHLIDEFYFSIAEFGFPEPTMRMTVTYNKLEGLYIPVQRKSYNKDGSVKGVYTFKNIMFNNGFTKEDLKL